VSAWNWDTSYARLPEPLWVRQNPQQVTAPALVYYNGTLARDLGLDESARDTDALAGKTLFPGSEPLAQAYCGHQFGHFTMLGDGRALLLGEHITPAGKRLDVQLKGSGRTPFSRGGDGRAALEPMLREVLISEALHAFGLPTTRCLAVIATGESVRRERPLPGAVLTRIAASHIRAGTFEFADQLADRSVIRALLAHSIARHDPDLAPGDAAGFFRRVALRQAELIAAWQSLGFVHGVMNTDNMAVSGESIDFGPCAFLDRHDAKAVFSSIDRYGRYAYGQQPAIGHWNLKCLAEALLEEMHPDPHTAVEMADEILEAYARRFQAELLRRHRARLGLREARPEDPGLLAQLLQAMEADQADHSNFFVELHPEREPAGAATRTWHADWKARLQSEGTDPESALQQMRKVNPRVIPRNHQVEAALNAAGRGDFSRFERLLECLRDPFNPDRDYGDLREPPPEGGPPYVTFCGT